MIQEYFLYIAFGAVAILIGFLIFQVFKLKKRLDIFLKGESTNLEGALKDLIKTSEIQRQDIEKIFEKISKLEKISEISFQKKGVVRYSPFKEVGGDQSFSIALLDAKNSGFVITSLYLRDGTRAFSKPIVEGKSEYPLSEEEKRAIENAINSRKP